MQNRKKKDTDLQNSLLDSVGEGEGGMFQENSIKTCILSRVKQIISPGWMHETTARTWCTGKTQRERVEREVGGGIGMGNTCKPMALSFQCMTKSTTNKKKKILTKVAHCLQLLYDIGCNLCVVQSILVAFYPEDCTSHPHIALPSHWQLLACSLNL